MQGTTPASRSSQRLQKADAEYAGLQEFPDEGNCALALPAMLPSSLHIPSCMQLPKKMLQAEQWSPGPSGLDLLRKVIYGSAQQNIDVGRKAVGVCTTVLQVSDLSCCTTCESKTTSPICIRHMLLQGLLSCSRKQQSVEVSGALVFKPAWHKPSIALDRTCS